MKRLIVFMSFTAASIAIIYASTLSPSIPAVTPRTADGQTANVPYATIGDAKIFVETAKDDAAREKGLSGRESLAENQGMLFIFARPYRWSFWMPDMRFPIDIVWINEGIVTGITPDVPPETNLSSPRFYRPPKPVRYALEVNAGFAKNKNIKTGDPVTFHNID